MKNILFAASECVPFIKTGGLADVVGSLPKYFDKKKYDVRVVLPKYSCMNQKWKDQLESGGRRPLCRNSEICAGRNHILFY